MEAMVRPRKDHFRTLVLDGGVADAEIAAAIRKYQITDDLLNIGATAYATAHAVQLSAAMQPDAIEEVVGVIAGWIENKETVRLIGAGRARLAGAIPGNRLAHCGVKIFHIYDLTPLPHTDFGGAVLACSASGKTPEVLGAMEKARTRNKNITIVGLASAEANEFRNLCDHFVGIYIDERIPNPLRFLASTGEYAISQLLDCLVVLGAKRAGLREEDLKHENLGPTGPYERRDLMTEDLGPSGPYYSSDEHDSK